MTRKLLSISFGAVLALALAVFAPSARANEEDQATRLTFNQPTELPGNVVLPAGTYWFVRPDGINMPNVVRVFSADWSKVWTAVSTIPTDRMNTTDHSQLTFGQQSRTQPVALMKWYYPDRLVGHEFVYPSRQEVQLRENQQITVTAKPVAKG